LLLTPNFQFSNFLHRQFLSSIITITHHGFFAVMVSNFYPCQTTIKITISQFYHILTEKVNDRSLFL